jgi:hypothetical protein
MTIMVMRGPRYRHLPAHEHNQRLFCLHKAPSVQFSGMIEADLLVALVALHAAVNLISLLHQYCVVIFATKDGNLGLLLIPSTCHAF